MKFLLKNPRLDSQTKMKELQNKIAFGTTTKESKFFKVFLNAITSKINMSKIFISLLILSIKVPNNLRFDHLLKSMTTRKKIFIKIFYILENSKAKKITPVLALH